MIWNEYACIAGGILLNVVKLFFILLFLFHKVVRSQNNTPCHTSHSLSMLL